MCMVAICLLICFGCGVNSEDQAQLTGFLNHGKMKELSGLAASRTRHGAFWVANDGKKEVLWAVHENGKVLVEMDYSGKVRDVEDLATGFDPSGCPVILVADCGDNDRDRDHIRVVVLKEPDLDLPASGEFLEIEVDVLKSCKIRYPEKNYDCETLMMDPVGGDLWLVSKEDNKSRFFRVSAEDLWKSDSVTAELVHVSREIVQVSGGDFSPDGVYAILRNESRGWVMALYRPVDSNGRHRWSDPSRPLPVRGPLQGRNGEAIAWSADGQAYYTVSEGENQPLYRFPLTPDTLVIR